MSRPDTVFPFNSQVSFEADTFKGDDTIYAGTGSDFVYAGGGKDEVYAGDSNDTVIGEGNDILDGGGRDDCVCHYGTRTMPKWQTLKNPKTQICDTVFC